MQIALAWLQTRSFYAWRASAGACRWEAFLLPLDHNHNDIKHLRECSHEPAVFWQNHDTYLQECICTYIYIYCHRCIYA